MLPLNRKASIKDQYENCEKASFYARERQRELEEKGIYRMFKLCARSKMRDYWHTCHIAEL